MRISDWSSDVCSSDLRFVVAAVQKATMFNLSPVAITPLLVPLSLLGWAAWSGASGLRTFLYLSGFICAMMLFGRPDNFYLAVMITPILFVGLLFAPAALRDLMTSVARQPHPGGSETRRDGKG